MKASDYISSIPHELPPGKVLVHNHIRHGSNTKPGANGFRAWLADATAEIEACPCGWASHLGEHYRMRLSASSGNH